MFKNSLISMEGTCKKNSSRWTPVQMVRTPQDQGKTQERRQQTTSKDDGRGARPRGARGEGRGEGRRAKGEGQWRRAKAKGEAEPRSYWSSSLERRARHWPFSTCGYLGLPCPP